MAHTKGGLGAVVGLLLAVLVCRGTWALDHEAQIGSVAYPDVKAAIEAAKPGETVALLKDAATQEATILPSDVTLDVGPHRFSSDWPFTLEQGATLAIGSEGQAELESAVIDGQVVGASAHKHSPDSEWHGWYGKFTDAMKHRPDYPIDMLRDVRVANGYIPSDFTVNTGANTLTIAGQFSVEDYATLNVEARGKVIVESGRLSIIEYGEMTVDGLLRCEGNFYSDGNVIINGSFEKSESTEMSFTDSFKLRVGFDPKQIRPISGFGGSSYSLSLPSRYVGYGSSVVLEALPEHFESWVLPSGFQLVLGSQRSDRTVTLQLFNAGDIALHLADPLPLTVSPEALALPVGAAQALSASEKGVTWSTSDAAIAMVSDAGVVQGIAQGRTIVTATAKDGRTAVCDVTVTKDETPEAPEADIGIDTLAVGKGQVLILPKFKGYTGTWAVEHPAVARLVKNGTRVSAVDYGETRLTYTVTAAPKKALTLGDRTLRLGDSHEIRLYVRRKGELVTKVSLGEKKLKLATVGEDRTAQLTATVKPNAALDRQIFFSSTNPKVATVDANGLVTAVAPGKCKVVAVGTSLKRKSIQVWVTGAIAVKPAKKTIRVGKRFELAALIAPALEDKTITWTSSDETVAAVDAQGWVTALRKGKATITATASNAETAKCMVTVKQ